MQSQYISKLPSATYTVKQPDVTCDPNEPTTESTECDMQSMTEGIEYPQRQTHTNTG
jgi:hypothetical protein